jgi:hypothetical protein
MKSSTRGLAIAVAILTTLLLLAGCAASRKAPAFLSMTMDQIPADARIAAAGVNYLVHNATPPADLGFLLEDDAALSVNGGGMAYKGFEPSGQRLFLYSPSVEDPDRIQAGGVIDLVDAYRRTARVKYSAAYRRDGKGIRIQSLTVAPYYATDQITELFLVPADMFPQDLGGIKPTWENLYLLVRGLNASAAAAYSDGSEKRDYLLFAFFRDHAAPSAEVKLMVANKMTSDYGWGWCSSGVSVFDFQGWRVAMVSGTFPAMPASPFYVKAYFRPGSEAPAGQMRLLFNEPLTEITKRAYGLN